MTIKPQYPQHIEDEHRAIRQYDIKALQDLLAQKEKPWLDETSLDNLELSMQKITPGRVAFIDYLYTIENYDGNRCQKSKRTLDENLVLRCLEDYSVFEHFYNQGYWTKAFESLSQINPFYDRQADIGVVGLLYEKGVIKLDAKFFLEHGNSFLETYLTYGLKHDCLDMTKDEVSQVLKEICTVMTLGGLNLLYEKYPHLHQVPLEDFFKVKEYSPFGSQFSDRFKLLLESHPARIDTYVNLTQPWFKGLSHNSLDNFFILCTHISQSDKHNLDAYCTYVDRRLKKIENQDALANFRQYYARIKLYDNLNQNLLHDPQPDDSPEIIRKLKI